MTIRKLPPDLVNQIAAGEVVERASSVVKELVENSVDAGARQIDVEIEAGGRKRIAVHDDGRGVRADQLPLAIASHATSKIVSGEDLLRVGSYGFRGEALASIASISRFRILSRPHDAEVGAEITCEGGTIGEVRPKSRAPGTTIEARDLFYNTPARRKFLKSDATEVGHVVEAVLRLSLARTDIGFSLQTGGRKSLKIAAQSSLRDRIAEGYGRELAQSLLRVERESMGLRISGFLAPPDQARARSRLQQLFINGRYVRDRTVQGAVRRAYHDFLAESLQPIYFLFLEVDPAEIDCNVHPTKIEVRLRNSSDIFRFVLAAVDRCLRDADLAPRVRMRPFPLAGGPTGGQRGVLPSATGIAPVPATEVHEPSPGSSPPRPSSFPAAASSPPAPTVPDAQGELFAALTETSAPADSTAPAAAPAPLRMIPGRYVQVLKTYLVTACEEGLLILDQHALHERVLYRQLRREWNDKAIQSQRLLTPLRVELSVQDVAVLSEAESILAQVGVEVAPFGNHEVAVSAVPACLKIKKVEDLLQRILSFLREERPHGRLDDFADRMLFTMACHRAVRAGDPLNEKQIEVLLAEAETVEHTHTCPHGRPTRIVVPAAELENLFKRRGF